MMVNYHNKTQCLYHNATMEGGLTRKPLYFLHHYCVAGSTEDPQLLSQWMNPIFSRDK